MNVKPKFVYYDIRRKQSVCLIMYTHENDVDTQVLEVSMLDNGEPIELSADYTYSAAIVNRNTKALINDSISCELNDSGNVLIPIDNFHTLGAQDLLIELTITDSAGDQVLVTPFPLWIHVNASILDDAQVTPESQGTVPELLEEAKEALENAGNYENLENKPQINGHELVGNKSSDDLGLQGKLTAGENITINANGEISATGGVTSYTELTDKPQIEGHELSGNKTAIELGLQKTITEGDDYIDLSSSGVLKLQKELVLHSERFTKSGRESLNLFPMNSIMYIPNPSTSLSNTPADITGAPALIVTLAAKDNYYSYHIEQEYIDTGLHGSKKYIRVGYYNYASTEVRHFYDWVEISANTTITSAVVNQNGTITFTNSDGSTFTTAGSSVIGADGFSPTATVTQTASGATISITDATGTTTANISNGDDYVLTPQDKTDIAAIVLSELPTTQGVQYGNASN